MPVNLLLLLPLLAPWLTIAWMPNASWLLVIFLDCCRPVTVADCRLPLDGCMSVTGRPAARRLFGHSGSICLRLPPRWQNNYRTLQFTNNLFAVLCKLCSESVQPLNVKVKYLFLPRNLYANPSKRSQLLKSEWNKLSPKVN